MGYARGDQPVRKAESSESRPGLVVLQQQIEAHREHDRQQSILKRVIGTISGGDRDSLSVLEKLQQEALNTPSITDPQVIKSRDKEMASAIHKDREALEWTDEVSHDVGGFLKTASLFLRGKIGLAGTMGICALDQINPQDSWSKELLDGTLGAVKGGLLKGTCSVLGDINVGIAAKGVGLGISSRVLEIGLTSGTYQDASGIYNLKVGLSRTIHGSLAPASLVADLVVFGVAHGLWGKANSLSGGAVERQPSVATVLTGTTFGLSTGAVNETMRQIGAGEEFDLRKIVKRGLLQAAIDSLAAAPGGSKFIKESTAEFRWSGCGAGKRMPSLADLLDLAGPQSLPVL